MDNRNSIQGDRQLELFESLRDAQTLITMRLRNAQQRFERLTLITDIKTAKSVHELIIDPPKGFERAAAALDPLEIFFTFQGADDLEYSFRTKGGRLEGNNLIVPFPNLVERLQRRRHFRVATPPGTQLSFTRRAEVHRMEIVNVSLGGALGVITKAAAPKKTDPVLSSSHNLHKIELSCPNGDLPPETISISKAVVRRIERDKEGQRHRYGIEFGGVSEAQLKKLTEFIYRIQRELLRRR